jgi:hypothetical protein
MATLALALAGPVLAQTAPQNTSPFRSVLDPSDGSADGGMPQPLQGAGALVLSSGPAASSGTVAPQADPYADSIPDTAPAGRSRTSPNYGRPRPLADKRLRYPGRSRNARRPLPQLQPYRTAPRDIRTRDPLSGPPPVQYASPQDIARRPPPRVETDPYAPLGINMGSMRVLPFVEASAGYDSNAGLSGTTPRGSSLSRIDAGFTAFSLWSRHRFTADVRGGYAKYFSDANASRPDGSARLSLQLDVTRDTNIDLELRGTLTTQRPGSPELNAAVIGRPIIASYGATAGVRHRIGRLEAGVSVLVDRTAYEDGKLSNGNNVRLSRDNFTATGLRGRLGYEITPGIRPFAEVTVDTRRRDEPVDGSGFARNSTGVTARLGSTFEVSRILTGEISGGYAQRTYADARLPSLAGPVLDASLVWTATPLTTVTFRAQTLLNETNLAGAAGSISRIGSVQIDHALLRNLNLGATALWQNNKYQGISLTENILSGTFRADYSLTRSVVIRGSYTHTRLQSSTAGADYTANVFLLGLRLQR